MIQLLDDKTIDKIAAGEVVEKPASVVKELVENAIDAKAKSITVEIKGGGIDFIRVTDDGCGIQANEVPTAFCRHATSKIVSAEDLNFIETLGFRGEALASISAVSCVEMITAVKDSLTGTRIYIEGSVTKEIEEVGAPQGTTIKISNLFYNTPARKKFLKSASTEASYIVEMMQHMALSRPDLSFKMLVNNQIKFHTSGNNDLKEVIYKIYGRETANCLVPIQINENGIQIEGYLGKPEINRGNRNCENYYVNRRYVKSKPISYGIEEGYKAYMMMHRFPFCVLHIMVDTETVDVNVHPTKMQVRLSNNESMTELLIKSIHTALKQEELIPDIKLVKEPEVEKIKAAPEPFEKQRIKQETSAAETMSAIKEYIPSQPVHGENNDYKGYSNQIIFDDSLDTSELKETPIASESMDNTDNSTLSSSINIDFSDEESKPVASFDDEAGFPITANTSYEEKKAEPEFPDLIIEKAEQTRFVESAILQEKNITKYQVLGQVFDTYWLVSMNDTLYFMDQHAAHEKIKYEEFISKFKNKEILSQNLIPPCIVSLQPSEMEIYLSNQEVFRNLSFEIDEFGGSELAIRAVPLDFYGYQIHDIFYAIIEELSTVNNANSITIIEERIATMACKAAVKGNTAMTKEEAEELITKLMTLDQPYHCPHGRPTMVAMSKYEIEKKFKRIV